jgi:Tol biopolymer transport system component
MVYLAGILVGLQIFFGNYNHSLLVAANATVGPLQPATCHQQPVIAFSTWEDNPGDIFIMTPDGTNRELIVSAEKLLVPGQISWSPEGTRLLFMAIDSANTQRHYQIYIADTSTHAIHNLISI